jgi:hypothetical protein
MTIKNDLNLLFASLFSLFKTAGRLVLACTGMVPVKAVYDHGTSVFLQLFPGGLIDHLLRTSQKVRVCTVPKHGTVLNDIIFVETRPSCFQEGFV